MASNNETGHAKNVANFNELIESVKKMGADYNPSTSPIKLASLQALQVSAKQALTDESATLSSFLNVTNRRAEEFEPLKELSTRIVAAFKQVAKKADIDDLKKYQRKIYGLRAGKKGDKTPPPPEGEQQVPDDNSISVAQLSFDNLVEHFRKMIDTVKLNPEYVPNEEDLAVDGLKTKLAELNAANEKIDTALTAWRDARVNRADVLYHADNGLVAVALKTKEYVKSAFKANSPQYKLVRGIKFKTLR